MMMRTVGVMGLQFQRCLIVFGLSLLSIATFFQNFLVYQIYPDILSKVVFTALFDLIMLLGILSYVQAIRTSPGHPPMLNQQNSQQLVPMCYLCNNWKPVRSHHCFVCNKCVLKMDHHCPWIANCVGFFNFKHFFLLSFHVALSGTIYIGELIYILFIDSSRINGGIMYKFYLITAVFLLPLIFSMQFIAAQNLANVYGNVTTIERVKGVEACGVFNCCQKNRVAGDYNQYDLGWVYNFEQILGKNGVLLWLVPWIKYKETGYEYHTAPIVGINELQQMREVSLSMNGKKITLGNSPEDYLVDVAEKYKMDELVYDDLLTINNIKPLA